MLRQRMLFQPLFSFLLLLQFWSPIWSFIPNNIIDSSRRPRVTGGVLQPCYYDDVTTPQFPICMTGLHAGKEDNEIEEEEESASVEEEEKPPPSPESTASDSDSVSDQEENTSDLQQAKLIVLESVVKQLNITRWKDQEHILSLQAQVEELEGTLSQEQEKSQDTESKEEEILSLQAQVVELEGSLSKEQGKYQTMMESRAAQETELLEEMEKGFSEERNALQSMHKADLQDLEQRILRQAQEEQDALQKELLEEVTNRKVEFKESLEIATAAVSSGEAREQALQEKLDHLETRYHEEAAQYKSELVQLQKEWKAENRRLEKDISKLTAQLTETKIERDKDTTALLDQLGEANMKLEQDLKEAQEQIQFQKLHFSTQQEVAKEEWQEQRDKERKFYMEAMRLLQEQQDIKRSRSFWRRLLSFGRGRKTKGSHLSP